MEFPTANLTFSYSYDVGVPSDQYLNTDKDNVFRALTWSSVKHMMYDRSFKLIFDREWEDGLQWKTQLRHSQTEPTYHLFYQPVSHAYQSEPGQPYSITPWGPGSGKNIANLN